MAYTETLVQDLYTWAKYPGSSCTDLITIVQSVGNAENVIAFDELSNQITIAPTDASHMGTTEILIMVNDSEGYVM